MRADARRNQKRILDAARAQIAETGSDVSMDQIAKAAGVAVGTLYRHYPTKTDLVHAVLTEFMETRVDRVDEASRTLTAPGDAMARITEMLTTFVEDAAKNQAVKESARVLDASYMTPELEDRGGAALKILIDRAAADGDLRPEISADDIYLMMLSAPNRLPKPGRDRWLEIMLAGLRQTPSVR
jgi:AcrR family transcriptional regulator